MTRKELRLTALHPQARNLVERSATAAPLSSMPVAQAREAAALMRAQLDPGCASGPVRDDIVESNSGHQIRLRCYEPSGIASAATIVWAHGGGWSLLDIEDADACARRLCHASGCTVASTGYRRAPEHPWPAALYDIYDVLQWAASDGRPLVLAGDSSGGNLAAAAALMARDRGQPTVAAQLLVYPVTDHDFGTPSYRQFAQGLPLTAAAMRRNWDMYVPRAEDRDHAWASPLRAESLANLPPAVIVVAGYDLLRSEVVAYADRLAREGVTVRRLDFDDMQHGFFTLPGLLDRAAEAIDRAGRELRALLAETTGAT
jgi:acetyl esterase